MVDIMPPLSPTEELVLDTLAARYRLGEQTWTFSTRVRPALTRLSGRGLVTEMHGIVEHTVRASLTKDGRDLWLSDSYTMSQETRRLTLRNKILATLREIDQPEAAALATLISHRLLEGGGA